MSDLNGKAKWLVPVGLTVVGLIFGSGWLAAVKTEAAFKQKTDSFLLEHANLDKELEALRTEAAIAAIERREIRESHRQLMDSMSKLSDKMALIIQRDMREGRIPR